MAIPKITDKVVTTVQESSEGLFAGLKSKFLPDLKAFAEKFGPTAFKVASFLAPLAVGAAVEGPLPKLVGIGMSVFIPFLLSNQLIDESGSYVPPINELLPYEKEAAETVYRQTRELLKEFKHLPSRVWVDWDDTLVRTKDGSIVGKTVGIVWAFYERGVEIGILSNAMRGHVEDGLDTYPVIKRFVSRDSNGKLLIKTLEDNEDFANANGIPFLDGYSQVDGIFVKRRVPLKIVAPDELWLDDIPPEPYFVASETTDPAQTNVRELLDQTVANQFMVESNSTDVVGLTPFEQNKLEMILGRIDAGKKRLGGLEEVGEDIGSDVLGETYQYMETMYRKFRYELFSIPFVEPLSQAEQVNLRMQIKELPKFWRETLELLYERQDIKEFFQVALALNLWPIGVDTNVTHFFQRYVEDIDDAAILTTYSPPATVRMVYPGYSMLVFGDRRENPTEEEIVAINRGLAKMSPVLVSIMGATFGTWSSDYIDDEVVEALQSGMGEKERLQLFKSIKLDEYQSVEANYSYHSLPLEKRIIHGASTVRSILHDATKAAYGATLILYLANYAGVAQETLVQWANGSVVIDVYAMAMLAAAARRNRITMSALRTAIIECAALPAKY